MDSLGTGVGDEILRWLLEARIVFLLRAMKKHHFTWYLDLY